MDIKTLTMKQSNGCSSKEWRWCHDHLFAKVLALLPELSRSALHQVRGAAPFLWYYLCCCQVAQTRNHERSLSQHTFALLSGPIPNQTARAWEVLQLKSLSACISQEKQKVKDLVSCGLRPPLRAVCLLLCFLELGGGGNFFMFPKLDYGWRMEEKWSPS